MFFLKNLFLLFLIFFFSACSFKGPQNISYQEAPAYAQDKSVNVYLDRYGAIYAPEDVLKDNYTKLFYTTTGKQNLEDIYKLQNKNKESWERLQNKRWQEKAKHINALLKKNSELVVLIHGYNVANSKLSYQNIRTSLKKTLHKNTHYLFVNIHWDGLKGPTPIGHWAKAQYNAPLVGLKLRKLFKHFTKELPIRVLTHSSGGIVAGSLVGDSSKAFEHNKTQDSHYNLYNKHRLGTSEYPVLNFSDLKIAMLVPATPATSFYNITAKKLTLIVGQNEDDFAVSKFILSGCSSLFGSTCLAIKKSEYEEIVSKNKHITFYRVDFSNSEGNTPVLMFWDSHNWEDYLKRSQMKVLLRLLFN